jgi:stage IV sporulation protein FB
MMIEPLLWSPINLGRWGGVQVRIHISLIIHVVFALLAAAISKDHPVGPTAAWLALLLLALAVHELGHAAMAWWLGAEPEDVRLWPLGNMVGPSPSSRSTDNWMVALAGPAVSLLMVIGSAIALGAMGAHFQWSPFGNPDAPSDPGAPVMVATRKAALAFAPAWLVGWFGYLNLLILVVNLLPALPFDNGRALRAYLANASVATAKDGMLAPWLARGFALVLLVVGLFRLIVSGKPDGLNVLVLAGLIELMVRAEARMYEDGGFFDDGVFGYDFSEGYTSLEGSAAKVRPYRESALKRWRRRRSDLRRQRRQAKEAAEERRMDEILEKLYREGRAALTEEENRFLVRVSARYRNRTKNT